MGDVEAEELDSPLARGAGVVGGAVPTAGATGVGESSIGGREEAKKGRGASGAGDQGLDIGRMVAMGVGVKGRARVLGSGGTKKEAVSQGAKAAKMVERGREEEHILGNKGLDNGRVGRGGTTTELLPLSKVMRASSGSRCIRCIT
jgi:hypothetical protein